MRVFDFDLLQAINLFYSRWDRLMDQFDRGLDLFERFVTEREGA